MGRRRTKTIKRKRGAKRRTMKRSLKKQRGGLNLNHELMTAFTSISEEDQCNIITTFIKMGSHDEVQKFLGKTCKNRKCRCINASFLQDEGISHERKKLLKQYLIVPDGYYKGETYAKMERETQGIEM